MPSTRYWPEEIAGGAAGVFLALVLDTPALALLGAAALGMGFATLVGGQERWQ